MPLLTVNALSTGLEFPSAAFAADGNPCGGAGDPASIAAAQGPLRRALDGLGPAAPVVVMVHGFRYDPVDPARDPHRLILSLAPERAGRRTLSWPKQMGFDHAEAGLGISFGWQADGHLWRARNRAAQAGRMLSSLVRAIRRLRPGVPVDLLAHSLGAEVALTALSRLDRGDIGRIILLAGATFQHAARAALDSPAGTAAEIINVASRENDVFDFVTEMLLTGGRARSIGQGLGAQRENWLDIEIDNAATIAALAELGYVISPTRQRICHWSPYLRPGVFHLYRALLQRRAATPLAMLRACLPQVPSPRWSRLVDRPRPLLPLPLPRKTSS